jgi:hypothetical protein
MALRPVAAHELPDGNVAVVGSRCPIHECSGPGSGGPPPPCDIFVLAFDPRALPVPPGLGDHSDLHEETILD